MIFMAILLSFDYAKLNKDKLTRQLDIRVI